MFSVHGIRSTLFQMIFMGKTQMAQLQVKARQLHISHPVYMWLNHKRKIKKVEFLPQLNTQTVCPAPGPHSGELRTHKLKSHLMRTQSLKVLPFKPGVGQYIAMHATLTARDFCLANFYPPGPFTCIVFKTAPEFFLCWLWLTPVAVWVSRIK